MLKVVIIVIKSLEECLESCPGVIPLLVHMLWEVQPRREALVPSEGLDELSTGKVAITLGIDEVKECFSLGHCICCCCCSMHRGLIASRNLLRGNWIRITAKVTVTLPVTVIDTDTFKVTVTITVKVTVTWLQ